MVNIFSYVFGKLLRRVRAAIVHYLLRRARRNLSPLPGGSAARLTTNLVIKKGHASRIASDAEATAFVAAHTTIPVPRIRYSWYEGQDGSLIMDHIEGIQLKRAWRDMSMPQKLSVMRRIAGFVEQLRAIPQPAPSTTSDLPRSGWIGGPFGSHFTDFMMTMESAPFGPFANEHDFNDWRVSRFKRFGDRHAPTAARIAEIRKLMREDHPIVFTHGDINRRNVLVRIHGDGPDDVEITALLDWEQAGWRPIYWECMKWVWEDGHTPVWGDFGAKEIGAHYEAEIELHCELQDISGHIP